MRKHFPAGVVALTLLAMIISAITLYAGDGRVQPGANSETCDVVDGTCVPFDETSSTSTIASNSSSPAFFSLSEAKARLTSAGCDPGQCKPMTPEQCAAAGYEPGECIPLTPDQCAAMGITRTQGTSFQGNTGAGIVDASAKAQLTSADCDPSQCEPMTPDQCTALSGDPGLCSGASANFTPAAAGLQLISASSAGPKCVPSTNCGTGSSGSGTTAMTMLGVRNPETGTVSYYLVPADRAQALLAGTAPAVSDI